MIKNIDQVLEYAHGMFSEGGDKGLKTSEGGLWLFLLFRFRRERKADTSERKAAFSNSRDSTLAES